MGNAAAPKNTTRSFVFQHADSVNCQNQNPKRVCGRPVIIESRQRRAGQFPVPIERFRLMAGIGAIEQMLCVARRKSILRNAGQLRVLCYQLVFKIGLRFPAEKSDIKPSALEVICKHCGMVARNSDFDIEQFVSKDGCGTRHSVRRTATAERIGTQLASAVKRWLR
jgi:hypothetical protein